MIDPITLGVAVDPDDNLDTAYTEHVVDARTAAIQADFARLRESLSASSSAETAQPLQPSPIIRRGVVFTPEQSEGILNEGADLAGRAMKEAVVTTAQLGTRILPGGVVDAVNSTLDTMRDVSSAMIDIGVSPEKRAELESSGPLADAGEFRVPAPPEPSTATGRFLRETTEFIAAFAGPSKKLEALRVAHGFTGKASKAVASEIAGAISAGITFDTAESALASLLSSKPELAKDVNGFLDAPDSSLKRVQTRLENSLVGLGAGLATRGVLSGLGALRQMRITRRLLGVADDTARVEAETAIVSDAEIGKGLGSELGDKLVRIKAPSVEPAEVSRAREVLRAAEERISQKFPTLTMEEIKSRAVLETTDVEINLSRINTTDDVRALIQNTTNLFKEGVDVARRGVRTHEATAEAAETLGWSASDVMALRGGQGFNAEETLAIRMIHANAAKTVLDLSDIAAGPGASMVDQFRFRRAYAAFEAINEAFVGARAEAGRTLNSFNIRAGDSGFSGKELTNIIDQLGGEAVSRDLAGSISKMRATLKPGQLSAMSRKGAVARTHDAVRESFTLGLLWHPGTHIANASSPYIVAAHQMAERFVAEKISEVLGRQAAGESFVAPGEALAMAHGFTSAVADMFSTVARDASETFAKTAGSVLGRTKAAASEVGKSIGRQRSALNIPGTQKLDATSGAIRSELLFSSPGTTIGKVIDRFGILTRAPGSALALEDDVGKTFLYRMELYARSLREATARGGTPEQIAENYSILLNSPTRPIRQAAIDTALIGTFTNDLGKFGKALSGMREAVPMSFVIFPFIKTPANLLHYNFERSPLAPLSSRFRADMVAGGARTDLAIAKLGLGVLTIGAFADMAEMGYTHGSGPSARHAGLREAYERNGIKPHSIDIGGVNYTVNRFDPGGFQISFGATAREHYRSFDYGDEEMPEFNKLLSSAMMAAAESSTSKSWLTGVSQLVDVVRGNGTEGPALGERVINMLAQQAGNMVPFSSAFRTARSLVDPTQPELSPVASEPFGSIAESIMAQFPILEEKLSRRLDLWGEDISFDEVYGRPADALLPSRVSRIEGYAIDREIMDNGMDVRKIGKRSSFDGVMVNFREFPRVYETYARLAGNGVKLPFTGKGALDTLNQMVDGKGPLASAYRQRSGGPDGAKRGMITEIIGQSRTLAQREILKENGPHQGEEFDRFRTYWKRKTQEARALSAPVRPGAQIGVRR